MVGLDTLKESDRGKLPPINDDPGFPGDDSGGDSGGHGLSGAHAQIGVGGAEDKGQEDPQHHGLHGQFFRCGLRAGHSKMVAYLHARGSFGVLEAGSGRRESAALAGRRR